VTGVGTRLIKAAAAEVADRESEIRVLLSQQLSSASVESGSSGGETEASTNLVDHEAFGELADHEDEESQIEKAEDDDQGDVDPQGSQKEEGADDEPGSQEDTDTVGELTRGISVSIRNTEARPEEGRVGQPETTERSESSGAEGITGNKLPHPSKDLRKTTDENGHTDNGVRNSNTTGLNVVHGEDESRAREGEEAERTRVADNPQLGGGVVNKGGGGEGRRIVSSGTMVMFVTHSMGVVDGTLLVNDVAHGGYGGYRDGD